MVSLHHQQHILHLMGIESWVEKTAATQTFQYSIWRDDITVHQPYAPIQLDETSHTSSSQVAVLTAKDITTPDIQEKIHQTPIIREVNHRVELNHQNVHDTPNIADEPPLKIDTKICLAICQGEHFVLITQFDDDIQRPQMAQRDDVKLWYNIQKFIQNTHQRYKNTSTQNRILTWQYDFIDLEHDAMLNFHQGYLDIVAQQKQVLVLGDTLVKQATWQNLPSLSHMLTDIDAKRQCYHALINLFAQL